MVDRDLQKDLVMSITRFRRMMTSGFGSYISDSHAKINMSELVLMSAISDNSYGSDDNVRMTDVSRFLSVSKAAVSQMLRSLENKGYITREVDRNNRRNVIVTLTPAGREVLEEQYGEFSRLLEMVVDRLGEDETREMIRIVDHMGSILDELEDERRGRDDDDNL